MTMFLSGEATACVVRAARTWQDSRMAAVAGGIDRFETDRKGDRIPVSNPDVWKVLGDAETALSAAVTRHRSTDLIWQPDGSEEVA